MSTKKTILVDNGKGLLTVAQIAKAVMEKVDGQYKVTVEDKHDTIMIEYITTLDAGRNDLRAMHEAIEECHAG